MSDEDIERMQRNREAVRELVISSQNLLRRSEGREDGLRKLMRVAEARLRKMTGRSIRARGLKGE